MKISAIDYVQDAETTQADDHLVLIASDLAGLARTAAFAFAKPGNHIVIASENDEAASHLADELRARRVDATFVHADTHNESDMQLLKTLTALHYGHLDIEYR